MLPSLAPLPAAGPEEGLAHLAEELRTILESEMKPAQVQGLVSNLKQEQIPIRR